MSDQHQHGRFPPFIHPSTLGLDVGKQPAHPTLDVLGSSQHISPPHSASPAAASPASFYHQYGQPHSPFSHNFHQGSPTTNMPTSQPHNLSLDPSSLRQSSVGPSRVLTRRATRAMMAAAHHPYNNGAVPRASTNSQDVQRTQTFDEGFGLYNGLSRPQTPTAISAGQAISDHAIALPELSFGSLNTSYSISHPGTPVSAASSGNYSHYGFVQYHDNGHTRTISDSTNKRSTSPAGSVVSAATSISSDPGRKLDPSRAPVSTGSIGALSALSPFHGQSLQQHMPSVKPKRRLSNKQRKEICQYHIDHPNTRQEDIAAQWGVERSTVSKILKHKNRWLVVDDGESDNITKHRPAKFAVVEERMIVWLKECRIKQMPITDVMIKTKAKEVAKATGLTEDKFKASAGWVENFKHRMNIKKGVWAGPKPPVFFDPDPADEGYVDPSVLFPRRERVLGLEEAREALAHKAGSYGTDLLNPGAGADSVGMVGSSNAWNGSLGLGLDNHHSFSHDGGEGSSLHPQQGSGGSSDQIPNGLSQLMPQSTPAPLVNQLSQQTSLQHHLAAARAAYAANGGEALLAVGAQQANASTSANGPSGQEAFQAADILARFLKVQVANLSSLTAEEQSQSLFRVEQERLVSDIKTCICVFIHPPSPSSAASDRNAGFGSGENAAGTAVASGPTEEVFPSTT